MDSYRYLVRNRAGRYGYIDADGKLAIDFRFDVASYFSEGLASVRHGKCNAFIDPIGRPQFFHDLAYVRAFSSGFAVCTNRDRLHGFIDRAGNLAIGLMFQGAASFSSGVAVVKREGKFGFIDRKAEEIVPCRFDYCHSFVENERVTTFKKDGKWGLVSVEGDIVCQPRWACAHRCSEGVVPVMVDGCWGLADLTGDLVLAPKFDQINFVFREGRIGVVEKGIWKYVDINGNDIGQNTFTYVEEFASGFGRVYVGGKWDPCSDVLLREGSWGYVDRGCSIVIPPAYDECEDFVGPLARVELGEPDELDFVFGYINRQGQLIWKVSSEGI